ncbi:unnamed protein product [Heligmosomoides polygyrus]|uniref:CMP/dCMP-type deaminase domain-containing protein n=1 Tax=Heligmosomoides polygyrus TaxID=6339 RepID=A0A183FF71_HELPZ|nr:unnamed protein product [Heligmosomoides polygyrus]
MSMSSSTPSEIAQVSAGELEKDRLLVGTPGRLRHPSPSLFVRPPHYGSRGSQREEAGKDPPQRCRVPHRPSSGREHSRTTGDAILNHKKLNVLSCTAVPNRDPCNHCAQAEFHLSQLKKVHKATLLHPELPLLSQGSGQWQIVYALKQVILEFERTQPVYLPTELDDAQFWRVARNDAEKLAERFRRREQRKRFLP